MRIKRRKKSQLKITAYIVIVVTASGLLASTHIATTYSMLTDKTEGAGYIKNAFVFPKTVESLAESVESQVSVTTSTYQQAFADITTFELVEIPRNYSDIEQKTRGLINQLTENKEKAEATLNELSQYRERATSTDEGDKEILLYVSIAYDRASAAVSTIQQLLDNSNAFLLNIAMERAKLEKSIVDVTTPTYSDTNNLSNEDRDNDIDIDKVGTKVDKISTNQEE